MRAKKGASNIKFSDTEKTVTSKSGELKFKIPQCRVLESTKIPQYWFVEN
jgi:hypothetical protein